MSGAIQLETPINLDELYLATGAELVDFQMRPAFTGDVFQLTDGRLVALIQHPCAMRRGASLTPKLLVCGVRDQIQNPPPDWSAGHFKKMFLPNLTGSNFVIDFDDIDVIPGSELGTATRLAILSTRGVNLLLQRWIFHNSRVVIPTITINIQSSGPFEEADLIQEAVESLTSGGRTINEAAQLADAWLGESPNGSESRREELADPQHRSVVRAAMRKQLKAW